MRPQLIPKKHLTNKAIATQLERSIKVASARLDMDVDHDAHKIVACVMWVILGTHRSAVAPTYTRTRGPKMFKSVSIEYTDGSSRLWSTRQQQRWRGREAGKWTKCGGRWSWLTLVR